MGCSVPVGNPQRGRLRHGSGRGPGRWRLRGAAHTRLTAEHRLANPAGRRARVEGATSGTVWCAKRTRLEAGTAGPGTRPVSSNADELQSEFPPVYMNPPTVKLDVLPVTSLNVAGPVPRAGGDFPKRGADEGAGGAACGFASCFSFRAISVWDLEVSLTWRSRCVCEPGTGGCKDRFLGTKSTRRQCGNQIPTP